MCIDIVEIWFGIANKQSSSIFDSYLPVTRLCFSLTITSALSYFFQLYHLALSVDWTDQKVVDTYIQRLENSTIRHICHGSHFHVSELVF